MERIWFWNYNGCKEVIILLIYNIVIKWIYMEYNLYVYVLKFFIFFVLMYMFLLGFDNNINI